jgi:hypothetical protein
MCFGHSLLLHRCHESWEKNQLPAQHHKNGLEVDLVPQELVNLTDMEIRLISRVKPFLKVCFFKRKI